METAKPRGQRPQHDPETGTFVVQMYSVHGNVRHVQTIRKPRVLGAQRRRQTGHGQEVIYLRSVAFGRL